jgi:hypothetical protein
MPLAQAGLLAHIDGRLEDLGTVAKEVSAIAAETGDVVALSVADVQAAFLASERGEIGGPAVARKWVAMVPDITVWRCFLTLLSARAGSAEEARGHIRHFAATQYQLQPDWQWLSSMAMLSEACAEIGQAEEAPLLYAKLAPHRDRYCTVGVACFFMGSVERYLGLLADLQGRSELASEHFEKAIESHARIGARLMLAHSLCDQALLLARATELGQHDRAAGLNRQAAELATELGLVHVQRRLAGWTRDPKITARSLN